MKRVLAILAATAFPVMLAVTVVSFAQQPQTPEGAVVIQRMKVVQGPDGAPMPPPPGDFFFIASEVGFNGKVVKGAPYSAQAVTETIQTLSDGNRIVNKVTSSLYRDSEGRTRREQTLKMLGPLGDSGEPLQTIFINDPVAGVTYALDSRSHIAHKSIPFTFERKVVPGAPGVQVSPLPGSAAQRFEFRVEGGAETGGVARASVAAPATGVSLPALPEGEKFIFKADGPGASTYVFTRKKPDDNNEVTEQLGRQIIEGVEAEGTRTTVTIPVGEIGNERPIEIVNERWYSPELQTVIMTRHSDPRSGETTYRLININRTEPPKSIFEVPADYTIKEGMPAPLPAGVMMPPKVRKPANPE